MRQKPGTKRSHGKKVVKEIRRATPKQYSAEEKIRVVLDGLKGEDSIAELCPARALRRACITAGPRNSSKPGRNAWRAIRRVRRRRARSMTLAVKPEIERKLSLSRT